MATTSSSNADLLQNHLKLQKVSVELIISMNNLSTKMDRMLSLFENAAKNIDQAEGDDSMSHKLEALLEQNKIIARGLVLIEKYIRDKTATGFNPSSFESSL